jgi:hypothetical protein
MNTNKNMPASPEPKDQAPLSPGAPDAGLDPRVTSRAAEQRLPLSGERILDLVALLVLIALAAVVFTVAGPAAFTAVTSVGVGLFATWRSTQRPR